MSEPYLPLYVGDYLRDTGYLTLEQHGAYCILLMRLWSAGGALPSDEGKLARIAGVTVKKWRPIWADLATFFELENGQITHKRITSELEKAGALRAKRAAAGAKGGAAKVLKTQEAPVANATAQPKQIIPDQAVSKEEPNGSSKSPRAWLETIVDPKRAKDVVEMRQRIRKPLTARAAELLAGQLSKWHDPNEAADAMVLNAWQGFKPEYLQNRARGSPSRQPFEKPDHFKNQALELADEQDRSSRSDRSDWDDAQGFPFIAIDYQR